MKTNNEALKKNLQEYFLKNPNLGRRHYFQLFSSLGATKTSLNRWLVLLEQNEPLTRKIGSGRIPVFATKATITRVKKIFNHRSGCSQRKAARKLGSSQSTISRILKERTEIVCRKRTKRPLLSDKQKLAARPKCRRLHQDYKGDDFILDDESYFTLANTTLAGNDRFYSDDLSKTPDSIKNKYKSKYEQKTLVYIAISTRGVSAPIFFKTGLAVNQHIYRDECLKKRLIPFIHKYHRDGKYVFWPDLASSHYALSVQDYLRSENIRFVPKNLNPANVPKVRPIEDYWGILKQKVYENDWSAVNIPQLVKRIKYCVTKLDKKLIQKICQSTHKRLNAAARFGIDSV
jgi:transcriptional regulator with XRE-family HTH domain